MTTLLILMALVQEPSLPTGLKNTEDPKNVPIVIAGGQKAGLKTGKHVTYEPGTPLCGLWISMLETAGVKARQLGDASDGLRGIA